MSADSSRSQAGRLDLALERCGETTRPTKALAQPPLQLSRVRYDAPDRPAQASFTLMHLGGVLAGDNNQLGVAMGEAAEAQIVGAGATQVYRMPSGSAAQRLTLQLAAQSRLAWLAAPLILFGGADYCQTTTVELAHTAKLIYLDILVPGRLARTEAFAFTQYGSRLEVYNQASTLLLAERAVLAPRHQRLTNSGVFGTTPVVGSLYLLGFESDRLQAQVHARAPLLATAELPNDCGLLVRALGTTASAVQAQLLHVQRAIDADD